MLAQEGLAKCSDYEKVRNKESDNHDEESCESERNTLEFRETELSLTSEASETSGESKSSKSAELLEKILSPKASFAPALVNKQKLLTPSAISTKSEDQSSKSCDQLDGAHVKLGSSAVSIENESSTETSTTGNQTRDQTRDLEQASSQSEVTSAAVNHDSVESSV